MGHLGLTPQSVHAFGGFQVQGKDARRRPRIVDDAVALAEAGCFAIVLECVPDAVARLVTDSVAGPDDRHRRRPSLRRPGARVPRPARARGPAARPKFVRRYARPRRPTPTDAVARFAADVRGGHVPVQRRDVPRGRRRRGGAAAVYGEPTTARELDVSRRTSTRASRWRIAHAPRRRGRGRSPVVLGVVAVVRPTWRRAVAGDRRRVDAACDPRCRRRSVRGPDASRARCRGRLPARGRRRRRDRTGRRGCGGVARPRPYDGMLFVFDADR